MLLEQLVQKASQPPRYDWDAYYGWLFSQQVGREVSEPSFWLCKKCLTVNSAAPHSRYGKCRSCGLIHLPEDMYKTKTETVL